MFSRRPWEHNGLMDAEQVARNDAIFREANEAIERAARELGDGEPVPFICECADLSCRELVRLTLSEYEDVRSSPVRFIAAAGHQLEGTDLEEVVARRPGYVVVEKRAGAAPIAAELDPRSE
jgi:hypothetical protein